MRRGKPVHAYGMWYSAGYVSRLCPPLLLYVLYHGYGSTGAALGQALRL